MFETDCFPTAQDFHPWDKGHAVPQTAYEKLPKPLKLWPTHKHFFSRDVVKLTRDDRICFPLAPQS